MNLCTIKQSFDERIYKELLWTTPQIGQLFTT
jgi:hypothetical protein